jgi:hypothetical protein
MAASHGGVAWTAPISRAPEVVHPGGIIHRDWRAALGFIHFVRDVTFPPVQQPGS